MSRLFLCLVLSLLCPWSALHAEPVKLSDSGLCHDVKSPWYDRTQVFTAFADMASCLEQGRAYSSYRAGRVTPPFDRAFYGGWDDQNGDCRNTRQNVLAALSTTRVSWDDASCHVLRGRWIDPYSGGTYLEAAALDIDHLVPLAFAHERGGFAWTAARRQAFANDERNLFVVAAGVNRGKGARGPLDWLPPVAGFRCEYVLRFDRIMRSYGLRYHPGEAEQMQRLRATLCARVSG